MVRIERTDVDCWRGLRERRGVHRRPAQGLSATTRAGPWSKPYPRRESLRHSPSPPAAARAKTSGSFTHEFPRQSLPSNRAKVQKQTDEWITRKRERSEWASSQSHTRAWVVPDEACRTAWTARGRERGNRAAATPLRSARWGSAAPRSPDYAAGRTSPCPASSAPTHPRLKLHAGMHCRRRPTHARRKLTGPRASVISRRGCGGREPQPDRQRPPAR